MRKKIYCCYTNIESLVVQKCNTAVIVLIYKSVWPYKNPFFEIWWTVPSKNKKLWNRVDLNFQNIFQTLSNQRIMLKNSVKT